MPYILFLEGLRRLRHKINKRTKIIIAISSAAVFLCASALVAFAVWFSCSGMTWYNRAQKAEISKDVKEVFDALSQYEYFDEKFGDSLNIFQQASVKAGQYSGLTFEQMRAFLAVLLKAAQNLSIEAFPSLFFQFKSIGINGVKMAKFVGCFVAEINTPNYLAEEAKGGSKKLTDCFSEKDFITIFAGIYDSAMILTEAAVNEKNWQIITNAFNKGGLEKDGFINLARANISELSNALQKFDGKFFDAASSVAKKYLADVLELNGKLLSDYSKKVDEYLGFLKTAIKTSDDETLEIIYDLQFTIYEFLIKLF